MLHLALTRESLRFLHTLDPKPYRQVLSTVLALLHTPEPHDSCTLKGFPFRRVDIGEYRIIYRVQAPRVEVAVIGKRNDDAVYKTLQRRA